MGKLNIESDDCKVRSAEVEVKARSEGSQARVETRQHSFVVNRIK